MSAVVSGFIGPDGHRDIAEMLAAHHASAGLDIFAWPASRFTGEPPPRRWLVQDVLPLGVPGLLAAQGDTGKSMSLLDLGRRVAFGQRPADGTILGGDLADEGTAVLITSEDDAAEIHRRLDQLDDRNDREGGRGDKLLVVPLPSAGGAFPLFRHSRDGMEETDQMRHLRDQLGSIADLKLVSFDPLQAFVQAPINEDPAAGQFVCSGLSALAAETGATVLLPHHMRKATTPPKDLAGARELVRGSTALVDGVRVAVALWTPDNTDIRKACGELGLSYAPNRIVRGGVIKANGPANRSICTYARNAFGLLVDRTADVSLPEKDVADQLELLVGAIRWAAQQGQPYSKTGAPGVWERRESLPDELRGMTKRALPEMVDEALRRGMIVQAAKGVSKRWLDVADGPFAREAGKLRDGAMAAPE